MIVDLYRVHTPEEMKEQECGVCGRAFEVGSVNAIACTDEDRELIGEVCPECVEYLRARNPERFPDLSEAIQQYPEPIWESAEESARVYEKDPAAYREAEIESRL